MGLKIDTDFSTLIPFECQYVGVNARSPRDGLQLDNIFTSKWVGHYLTQR